MKSCKSINDKIFISNDFFLFNNIENNSFISNILLAKINLHRFAYVLNLLKKY